MSEEMAHAETLIREIQKGLLEWYSFEVSAAKKVPTAESGIALYIGAREDPIAELPAACGQCAFPASRPSGNPGTRRSFDYIICIEILEQKPAPESFLASWRSRLNLEGRLHLGLSVQLNISRLGKK